MAPKRRTTDATNESTAETNQVENMTEATVETAEATEAKKKPAKTREAGTRLTGQELLAYTDTNAPAGKTAEELALGAGYFTRVTDTETGATNTKIHAAEFYKAIAEASRGITIAPSKRTYTPRRNRAQLITIGTTGNCVVGARYTTAAGFQPGSKVSVTVEGDRVTLSASTDAPEAPEAVDTADGDDDMDL